MKPTLAFDVYGTLIDTQGVVIALKPYLQERAAAFSGLWREKQLEYSFRKALMQRYEPFAVCTAQALDYACEQFELPLGSHEKAQLLKSYQALPAFSDVIPALLAAKEAKLTIFAFTNGARAQVETLLTHAKIDGFFNDIVSVDEVQSFKPDPKVYAHLLKRTGSLAQHTWLVSSNPFDIVGGHSHGLKTAWVRRSAKVVFDPWHIEPDWQANNLLEVIDHIKIRNNTAR